MPYQHHDGSGNWFLHLFSFVGGVRCVSHISSYAPKGKLSCTLSRYHKGRHYDADARISWAYGDDFFGD
jgi:hypothetical protein